MVMVFNATFNNISDISWQSVLLVGETGLPGENHRPVVSHWQTLYHIMFYRVHLTRAGFELTTLVVIGTDCICSYKSNYHTFVIATTAPVQIYYRILIKSININILSNFLSLFIVRPKEIMTSIFICCSSTIFSNVESYKKKYHFK